MYTGTSYSYIQARNRYARHEFIPQLGVDRPDTLMYIDSKGRLTVNELSDDQFYPGYTRNLF
jgi:hypothetical protein